MACSSSLAFRRGQEVCPAGFPQVNSNVSLMRFMTRRTGICILLTVALAALMLKQASRPGPDTLSSRSDSGAIPETALPAPDLPDRHTLDGYASSDRCRSCHADEFESWHRSFHRTMTQVATADTVLAPFDDLTLQSRGRTYHLSREADQFFVQMPDPNIQLQQVLSGKSSPEPPSVQCRVVLTTGSHHVQAYWVEGDAGNALYSLPMVYHLADKRWLPREDAFLAPPDGERHFKTWNMHCISCHSTNGRPEYDFQKKTYSSTAVEAGIACESCHGPAAEHIRLRKNAEPGSVVKDDPIVNPARLPHVLANQACGQCHSAWGPKDFDSWMTHGHQFRPGQDLNDSVHLIQHLDPNYAEDESATTGLYWPDGTIRVGGREYQGILASRCYIDGALSCMSCHSMHRSDPSDQLAVGMDSDQACLQCHPRYAENVQQHTHHAPESAGSRCYNCHMPHTTYALFKGIRSHRIDSPKIHGTDTTSRPNACNLCHLDRSLDWTAKHLSDWFGITTTTQDPLTSAASSTAASVEWLLKGDAAQRVLAAWTMGWEPAHEASSANWLAPHLAQLLNDPYSAVRYVAARSLKKLPGFQDFNYDFLASSESREQAVKEALKLWKQTGSPVQFSDNGRVLYDPDGQPELLRIKKMIEQRDDRPLEISE